jgi:hypothetical protein
MFGSNKNANTARSGHIRIRGEMYILHCPPSHNKQIRLLLGVHNAAERCLS